MNATVGGLFDGCGLLAYGLHFAGWEHRWLCERDEFRQGILRQRFPGVPVYPDVRAVDGSAERPVLVAGGFPCKGGSTAGKREGLDHPETALWHEMARVVRDVRPRFVLIENVANLLAIHDGAVWGIVLGDLAEVGYDVEWDCLPATVFGAPHRRDRVFAVATDTTVVGHERSGRARQGWVGPADGGESPADAMFPRLEGRGLQGTATNGTSASAYAEGKRREGARSGRAALVRTPAGGGVAGALADSRERGCEQQPPEHRTEPARSDADPQRRGVPVEWGPYGPAITRWERVHGAAPEPLVRRVDDRGAARVERSRLSALGDGVQVQAGYFMGRLIMDRLA